MTLIIRTLLLPSAVLLLLFLGCSGGSPVKVEPLSSPFTTEVMTESWLAIQTGSDVLVMHPDGSDTTRLASAGLHSWSPGATWLAVRYGSALSAFSPESRESHSIYDCGGFGSWSPDGSRVAYMLKRNRSCNDEIWLRDIVSGEQEFLSQGVARDWSSDGRWIATEWCPEGFPGGHHPWIYLASVSGEAPVLLDRGGTGTFSRDSEWVSYSTGELWDRAVWAARIDRSEKHRIYQSEEVGYGPWSPTRPSLLCHIGARLYAAVPGRPYLPI